MTIIIDPYLALALAMGVWLWAPVRDAARALATRKPKRIRPWPGRGGLIRRKTRELRQTVEGKLTERCHEWSCVKAGLCLCDCVRRIQDEEDINQGGHRSRSAVVQHLTHVRHAHDQSD